MTVEELIKALEKIEDKSLEVVVNSGLDFWGELQAEVADEVIETEEYFGAVEYGGWCSRVRKCVKII